MEQFGKFTWILILDAGKCPGKRQRTPNRTFYETNYQKCFESYWHTNENVKKLPTGSVMQKCFLGVKNVFIRTIGGKLSKLRTCEFVHKRNVPAQEAVLTLSSVLNYGRELGTIAMRTVESGRHKCQDLICCAVCAAEITTEALNHRANAAKRTTMWYITVPNWFQRHQGT